LVTTRDLIDRHAVKAVSIEWLIVTNQAGLASRRDLIIGWASLAATTKAWTIPAVGSGGIGDTRDRD
jgi:methionine synthase II (cobalamin-independent)